jgi:hypothetical protein
MSRRREEISRAEGERSQEAEEAERSQEAEEEQPETEQPEMEQPETVQPEEEPEQLETEHQETEQPESQIVVFQRRLPTRGHRDTAEIDTLLITPFETRVADDPTAFCKSLYFRPYPPKGESLTIACTPQ